MQTVLYILANARARARARYFYGVTDKPDHAQRIDCVRALLALRSSSVHVYFPFYLRILRIVSKSQNKREREGNINWFEFMMYIIKIAR